MEVLRIDDGSCFGAHTCVRVALLDLCFCWFLPNKETGVISRAVPCHFIIWKPRMCSVLVRDIVRKHRTCTFPSIFTPEKLPGATLKSVVFATSTTDHLHHKIYFKGTSIIIRLFSMFSRLWKPQLRGFQRPATNVIEVGFKRKLSRLVSLSPVPFFPKGLRFHLIVARSTYVNLQRLLVASCSERVCVVSSTEYGVSAIGLHA